MRPPSYDRPLSGMSQRLPPSNLQAEQALLGAILANNRAYEQVSSFLREEHFADPLNGRIYAALAQRIDAGRHVDAVSLKNDFEGAGILEEAGGIAYLAQLLSAMVAIINTSEYGRAVHDAWWRRELIDIGEELIAGAFNAVPGETGRDVHERAEERLFVLGESGRSDEAVSPAHEAMALAIDAAVKASLLPGGLVGLTTGLRELDDMTGGLKRGRFYLFGARPSMGKTTFALTVAVGAALAGARVLFVSREMTRVEIGAQLAAGLADVARDAAERGRVRYRDSVGRFAWRPITPVEIDAMMAAQRRMVQQNLVIDECRSGTMASIRAQARKMRRRGGLDLILVDYLGQLRVPELQRSDNRVLEVTRLSGQTKDLARDMDVPVWMLTQLNRGTEGRENKRPTLADLRDSGALEQDADCVMFLYREHYYLSKETLARTEKETDEQFANRCTRHYAALGDAEGKAEVIFAKQRQGPTGTRRFAFNHETTWFGDLPDEG